MDETLDVEGVTLVRPLRSFHVLLFIRDLANIPARFLGGAQVVFSLFGADYRVRAPGIRAAAPSVAASRPACIAAGICADHGPRATVGLLDAVHCQKFLVVF